MTRCKNPEAAEKEAHLQEAITAVLNGDFNGYQAARHFNVPKRTLYDRVKLGKKPRNQAHECDQNLTIAEEKELVGWITRLTIIGYPPRYQTLREMAEEIRKRRVRNINEVGMILVEYLPIGKGWVRRFLQRHNELSAVRPRSIEMARVKAVSRKRLQQWFDDLHDVLEKYRILPENIYNMDETGFAIGEREVSRVIINVQMRQRLQAKPGRQEWVSIVECVCADGSVVPPLVIFKAESFSTEWIPANIYSTWKFSYNSRGWTSNEHGIQWLTRCFEPATREKAKG